LERLPALLLPEHPPSCRVEALQFDACFLVELRSTAHNLSRLPIGGSFVGAGNSKSCITKESSQASQV
jgi:hypothetical protein